ncbi:MAG: alpha/beta hydrolase [Pseudonocardia sp.]|nr:alpha/beta hydrolase [Pseudonocardia sp.]
MDADLSRRGHDLADAAVAQIADRDDVVVVAHSFGGFTGPLVRARRPVRHLVFLTAMIPTPGEAPGDWWANTGHAGDPAADADDEIAVFLHDVEPGTAAEALRHGRPESDTPMGRPWPLPAVPTTFLLCRDDRYFPAEFPRRAVRERLGIEPVEMAGGHHPMLSRPVEPVDRLAAVTV